MAKITLVFVVFRPGDGGCVWFPSKHHYFYLPEWAGKEHFMKKLFKKFEECVWSDTSAQQSSSGSKLGLQ